MTRFRTLIIFSTFFFLAFFQAFAQIESPKKLRQVSSYYQELSWKLSQRQNGKITLANPITAISISISLNSSFSGAYIVADGFKHSLQHDGHALENETRQFSQLIHFDQPVSEVQIYSGEIEGEFNLLLISGQSSIQTPKKETRRNLLEDCIEPTSIDQSVWRAGLAAPNYTRSFTQVEHVIVHHSAGSNSATNYTQVVRDIYIFHTEGRGWSDVGYNYLIAQDGTIFKGRDPGNGVQDNVIGAHFCGGNTNTMGICLLGDYNLTTPTVATIASLEDLITWKLKKENLDALGFSSHPLNSNLGNIGGHRDGCATDCPGNNTYGMLPEIRQNVSDKLDACSGEVLIADFSVSDTLITEGESVSFADLSIGEPDSYEWAFEGGEPSSSTLVSPTIRYDEAGSYSVSLKILKAGRERLIRKEALVNVEEPAEEKVAVLYPNPVKGLSVKLANVVASEVKEIYFIDEMGRRINILNPENEGDILAISTSQLNQGIYLLYVVFADRLIKQRILVL